MSRHMKLKEMVNERHYTKWKSDLSQQVQSQYSNQGHQEC